MAYVLIPFRIYELVGRSLTLTWLHALANAAHFDDRGFLSLYNIIYAMITGLKPTSLSTIWVLDRCIGRYRGETKHGGCP
jgi:hypothetical protein